MKRQDGFTLIEILLAMGVFLVGVVSILAVFPKAVKQTTESNDDNIAAAFAESMMETLSKGLKAYTGDPEALTSQDDLVWFTLPLEGSQKDYFVLPKDNGDLATAKDTEMTWYPVCVNPTAPGSCYLSGFSGLSGNPNAGFTSGGTEGRVRRMGRSALGSSDLVKSLESTEEDLPERLKDFFWCFSVKHEGTTPNLYHFTLYIFHKGVTEAPDTITSSSQVLDDSRPQAKANKFLHKFDFLIGRT